MPKVKWVILYDFCSKFHSFPTVQRFWKSVKILQSYREFKGGYFFETQCRCKKATQKRRASMGYLGGASLRHSPALQLNQIQTERWLIIAQSVIVYGKTVHHRRKIWVCCLCTQWIYRHACRLVLGIRWNNRIATDCTRTEYELQHCVCVLRWILLSLTRPNH